MNTLRLLSEFHAGSLTLADTWRAMLAPDTPRRSSSWPSEAGRLGDAARASSASAATWLDGTATTAEMADAVAAFHFPDDLWARRDLRPGHLPPAIRSPPIEALVAALVPIYFGRVGSFVIENRAVTTDQAEERVERQAREFELLKPYLVNRWKASSPARRRRGGAGMTSRRRCPPGS